MEDVLGKCYYFTLAAQLVKRCDPQLIELRSKMQFVYAINFILVFNLFRVAQCWHLARVGLNESYRVLHLSTHYSRVFLSIAVESQTFPTLIESLWPERYLPMFSLIFPRTSLHANGNHEDCTRLQQAVWSQVDSLSRLWVMDVGWQHGKNSSSSSGNSVPINHVCPPKLMAFDLLRNNVEVMRIDCSKYIRPAGAEIITIKLGPQISACSLEKFIYFILADDSHILAYDIVEQTWQRRLLISRKYQTITDVLPIKPQDLAFGKNNEMFISDVDGALYSSSNAFLLHSTNAIKHNRCMDAADIKIELKLLGSLLGPSKGMITDGDQDALFYVAPKFGAVVRCEPKANLTAEGNEIIYMTSRNVQQLFFGTHGSVWLLSDRWLEPLQQCFPG